MPVDIESRDITGHLSPKTASRARAQSGPFRGHPSMREYAINPPPAENVAGGRSLGDDQLGYRGDHGRNTSGQPRILSSPRTPNVGRGRVNGSASAAGLVRRVATSTRCGSGVRATRQRFRAGQGLAGRKMSRPQLVTQTAARSCRRRWQSKLVDVRTGCIRIQLPSGTSSVSAFSIAPDATGLPVVSRGRLTYPSFNVGTHDDDIQPSRS